MPLITVLPPGASALLPLQTPSLPAETQDTELHAAPMENMAGNDQPPPEASASDASEARAGFPRPEYVPPIFMGALSQTSEPSLPPFSTRILEGAYDLLEDLPKPAGSPADGEAERNTLGLLLSANGNPPKLTLLFNQDAPPSPKVIERAYGVLAGDSRADELRALAHENADPKPESSSDV